MKIGLLQYDVKWLDVKTNFKTIEFYLSSCDDKPNIIFLPEMFDTGYIMEPHKIQNFNPEYSILEMTRLAGKYKVILAGSIPNKVGENYYNSFFYVNGKGIIGQYDKVHLFSLAGESQHYTSGKQPKDIEIANIKIRPQVCYDLRFPYSSYNNSGYDILAFVANWPKPRISQWQALLEARAIENQAYVIGVNRIGLDANGYEYNGHSMVADYTGTVVLDCQDKEGLFTININLEEMNKYRLKLPFLQDQIKTAF